MKILHVGKWYPSEGGIETVRDNIVYPLSEEGVDCDMMCESRGRKPDQISINDHCKIHIAGTRFYILRVPLSFGEIPTLRKIANSYDIIHIHQPNPISLISLMLSGYKGKVVTHWHCDIAEQPLLRMVYSPLQTWLLKRSDIIIATTQITADTSPYINKYKGKIKIVPIGIPKPKKQLEKAKEIQDTYKGKKIIFSMGRLSFYKGFNYLIDAMKELPDDYICLIGGKGPDREMLDKQIEDNQLGDRVKMLGYLTEEQVSAYYDSSILFCMPSINKGEAFGIVQIEAMGHGKPVVTTNIPGSGVPWVNAHGVSGLNVEPANAHELAEAIQKIAEDKTLCEKLGKQAEQRFDTMFERGVMVKKCMDIYKSLIG